MTSIVDILNPNLTLLVSNNDVSWFSQGITSG